MSRTTYVTLAEVQSYLSRQLERVEWAPATSKGQPAHDTWRELTDCTELPKGKRLLVRPGGKDGTGGVHVFLTETALAERRTDPLVAEERARLATEREAFLREREEFLTWRIEQTAAILEMRGKAEAIVLTVADRFGAWEKRLDERAALSVEKDRALLDAIGRADVADNHRAMVASATYFLDRLVNLGAMVKVKGLADIPPDMVKRFERFLAWEAECGFVTHLPEAEAKYAKDFLKFPPTGRDAILRAITEAMRATKERQTGAMG